MSSTFNREQGELAKQEGMGRAARGANPEWVSFMLAALIEVARRQPYFFTDDIERIRIERGGPSTPEPRAMGPLMKRAQRDGICELTTRFVTSARVICHCGQKRVWKSMLYRAAKDWPGVDWPR
jgi:hypothetical protein